MEPTLSQIDDYDGKESREKRQTVQKVIVGLLIIGIFYAVAKDYFSTVPDELPQAKDSAYMMKN
jgi:hypothetical protein